MEKRLHENCQEFITSEKPKVATFHSLCLEIVSMFTHELSMPFEFEIMEKLLKYEQKSLIYERMKMDKNFYG
jgi:superfamily I DNA/RNA helicase